MPSVRDSVKANQLRKYKIIATALFVLLAMVYIGSHLFVMETKWIGYIRAFSEAGMVGALADWFAVVALFRHPLGLPIPHTNLIEGSKTRIGDNLGIFVTQNFLNPATIRPRMKQLQVAKKLGEWLNRPGNRNILVPEILGIAEDGLAQLNDSHMERLIARQAEGLLDKIPFNTLVGSALESIVQQGLHEEWIQLLAKSIADFIEENANMVKDKVKSESHFLIPGFVDNIIAAKITKGAISYFRDLEAKEAHPQREQITRKLLDIAADMKINPKWAMDFESLKEQLLSENKMQTYAGMLWKYLKDQINNDLAAPESGISKYLDHTISDIASDLMSDLKKQERIDGFVQLQAFKLILSHRHEVSDLISNTVGNWKGRELSDKLELEVGKDLQFIRLNGTLVGGLVGLLIYALTQWLQG
jgi:uncharacterized membrane-anchored protein YjiN (DUF445 family)